MTILTMHRFAVPDLDVPGHDPVALAQALGRLRRSRTPVVSLPDVLAALTEGCPLPPRAVVFTVDDGYFDFAEVAAPVFAEYDCPVTVFLVTGFLDRICWLWWDRIRYIFANGELRPLVAGLWKGAGRLPDAPNRVALAAEISRLATQIPQAEVETLICWLAERAGVRIPEHPPEAFRPMTWEGVRAVQGDLVSFGPHTITHPILPRTTPAIAEQEIQGSWRRLREVLTDPLPVFSYPNGDHGMREIEIVRGAGLRGAVSTVPTYLTPTVGLSAAARAFQMPRFPYPDHTEALLLTALGFRRIQQALRSRGSEPREIA